MNYIDPQIERFLKIDQATLRSQYRQYISLQDVEMRNEVTADKVIGSIIPYKIDRDHDQTIRYIRLEDCRLNDGIVERII